MRLDAGGVAAVPRRQGDRLRAQRVLGVRQHREAGAAQCVQAYYGAQRDRLLLVQYDTLTSDPGKTMHAIYDFLDEPYFEHDFDHVDYDVTEFDERAGTPGLHTVRGTVKAEPRETLLPPELFNRFANDAFWRDPARTPAGLRVV